MGQILISVEQGSQNPVETKVNLADEDIDRIVAAYQDPANKQKAANTPPPDPGQPPEEIIPPEAATQDEVLQYWAYSILDYSNGQIINYERAQQQAAMPPPVPIEPLMAKS
jgi:hypothetical protein